MIFSLNHRRINLFPEAETTFREPFLRSSSFNTSTQDPSSGAGSSCLGSFAISFVAYIEVSFVSSFVASFGASFVISFVASFESSFEASFEAYFEDSFEESFFVISLLRNSSVMINSFGEFSHQLASSLYISPSGFSMLPSPSIHQDYLSFGILWFDFSFAKSRIPVTFYLH